MKPPEESVRRPVKQDRPFIHGAIVCISLLLGACSGPERAAAPTEERHASWEQYRGDPAVTGYSSLDQINRSTVLQLERAWIFHTGDEQLSTIECNPIIVGRTMYVTSPTLRVIALDAATGQKKWSFDPFEYVGERPRGVSRGVTFWRDAADARIYASAGPYLFALDAGSGEIVPDFGNDGLIDLRKGLGRPAADLRVEPSSPPIIFEDLLITGSVVGEGPGPSAPGHIRAYDVRTGEPRWIFRTIPHPGEFGYETWPPEAWKTVGGANSWGGFSMDHDRGILYAPTGSASYDHFGGDRHGDNLFANSIIALDARSGRRIWHFQTVHHDLWDYDVPTPPNLVTLRNEGQVIDAVAQPTKMGHLFVLDRLTGEPVYPVEERGVPQTRMRGEQTSPTQPFPIPALRYAQQGFTDRNRNTMSPEADAFSSKIREEYGEAVLFSPPSEKGDVVLPQFNGGTDWGGASYDPTTGILYVNASDEAEFLSMVPAPDNADHPHPFVATGHQPIRGPDGYPINKRPWGTLTAIDLNRPEILWQEPLGTYPRLEAEGFGKTGTFNMGGSVVTAGGLVFIAASMDERMHAYDKKTGDLLWEADLPAGGYATPATYQVNGRQYVVIAAGGGGKPGTTPGDAYVAFALP